MKTAATPTATAARASTGTNSPLSAARRALPARLLHRMGRIEHHGAAGLCQLRQAPHVRDQCIVAEACAPLAHQHPAVAGAGDLRHHVAHVPRREELALLHVDRLIGRCRRQQQVGLAAEERRNLKHVHGLRHRRALLRQMHVGQHRAAVGVPHRRQDGESLVHADAAWAAGGGAVGLVEGALVDERHTASRRHRDERLRDPERVISSFDRTGAGDERKRQRVPHLEGADRHPA